ncbi:hypothetical protein [Algoriphagus sp. CAU 1675]|uniref:hypothetical protein n=1 Tax=Algoriphagus sp. CAU 1675 TaxID=3032597 RepID=UPI0023DAE4C3|nr:hypothetical protein [Algoriphagus sp. CAU 1675]MDF2159222.1 hypothetical protein [Algoriphagus sp. CAU 1675]
MKSSKLIFLILAAGLVVLIAYIFMESFSQPGLERFEGKYEQIGFFRNENNTGPVIRVYAVRCLDSKEDWMEDFGNAQPHTKYGRTLVFFFSEDVKGPIDLNPKEPFFDAELNASLLGSYEKTPMGEVRFTKGVKQ